MKMSKRRLKALVFLDHSIIVRHFVQSKAFAELERRHDVRYVTLPEGDKRIQGADFSAVAPDRLLRLPGTRERHAIWQRMFQIDLLRGGDDPQAKVLAEHLANAVGAWTARIYRFYGLPVIWQIYRRILAARARRLGNAELDRLIDGEKPDILIYPTAMAGAYLNELVDVSYRKDLRLIAIMNSWDNPSIKRAMVGHPELLLVWGPQTLKHAVKFARMPLDNVECFGAAQFEVYKDPPSMDRTEFCRRHGVDPSSTLVLYAGSSKGCDEYADLNALEEAVVDGRLAGVKIVYRPHPWGDCGKDGGRIGARDWRHVVVESTMSDYVRRAASGTQGITTPDYANTRDTLANVDAVLSPLSTILLEAALNGKPPLCVVDDEDLENHFVSVANRFVHFREFFDRPEFDRVEGRAELVAGVARAVARAKDPSTPAALRSACAEFVSTFDLPFDVRLADRVERLVSAGSTR
jgi:hypothetical protein